MVPCGALPSTVDAIGRISDITYTTFYRLVNYAITKFYCIKEFDACISGAYLYCKASLCLRFLTCIIMSNGFHAEISKGFQSSRLTRRIWKFGKGL